MILATNNYVLDITHINPFKHSYISLCIMKDRLQYTATIESVEGTIIRATDRTSMYVRTTFKFSMMETESSGYHYK